MLRIRDCLEAGGFVGMLADRTIGEAPAQRVSFLGTPALFPSGPDARRGGAAAPGVSS